jgi:hypothetical protein
LIFILKGGVVHLTGKITGNGIAGDPGCKMNPVGLEKPTGTAEIFVSCMHFSVIRKLRNTNGIAILGGSIPRRVN